MIYIEKEMFYRKTQPKKKCHIKTPCCTTGNILKVAGETLIASIPFMPEDNSIISELKRGKCPE